MRLDAVPEPVDDEPPALLAPLPDDVLCEADAVAVDFAELLDEAFAVVFVVLGAGVLGAACVEATPEPPCFELVLVHGVGDAVVFAAAELLLDFEGDEVVLVAVPLGLLLVLVPPLGLGLTVPVPEPAEDGSGVGDGVGEAAGLDFVAAGVDELFVAADDVDEAAAADWLDLHDAAAAGAVVAPADASLTLWLPGPEDWPAAPALAELPAELCEELPSRPASAD